MKIEIPPAAIVGIVVVVVLILGFLAFKQFGGDPAAPVATAEQKQGIQQMRSAVMAPGVHRDAEGHFVDAEGKPVNFSAAPTRPGR